MITDVYTRVWDAPRQMGDSVLGQLRRRRAAPWSDFDAGEAAHREAMSPVHHAIVHGIASRRLSCEVPVDRVAELVARGGGRLLGFAGIDPLDDANGGPAAAVERAKALGLVGVTVSPPLQGFHPEHSRAMALYEACAAGGMPVAVEPGLAMSRGAMMEHAAPAAFDAVAREFPELRLMFVGLGDPFVEQTLALMAKHPTVFGELSAVLARPWRLYNALVEAHQLGVMSQLLFGSGFPQQRADRAIVAMYSASSVAQGTNLPGVPREQLRAVVERDALSCLGLQTPRAREVIDAEASSVQPPRVAGVLAEASSEKSSGEDTPAVPDPRSVESNALEGARR